MGLFFTSRQNEKAAGRSINHGGRSGKDLANGNRWASSVVSFVVRLAFDAAAPPVGSCCSFRSQLAHVPHIRLQLIATAGRRSGSSGQPSTGSKLFQVGRGQMTPDRPTLNILGSLAQDLLCAPGFLDQAHSALQGFQKTEQRLGFFFHFGRFPAV